MTSPTGGGLRKQRRGTFVQVPSATIRDASLSYRARGVLAFLLDHPDGWKVDAAAIAREGREGREAIEAALRELRAAGYYRLERRRLPGGSFAMGTAVAEEADPAWAAAHAAHAGGAVAVRVHLDGTVTELDPATNSDDTDTDTGNGFSGPGAPGSAEDAPGEPAANYSDSDADSEGGGELVGDVTSAPSRELERPTPTCQREHARGDACGACRADRLALEAWEAQTIAGAKHAAKVARTLARLRQLEQRADSELDVERCPHCDDAGIATVVVKHPDRPDEHVPTICQHDTTANSRAVEARLAIKATLANRRTTTVNTPEA